MTIDQFDLDARFAELAARIDAPDVPVTDDLQRGRRRQLRQRLVVAGAVVATVAVVGSAVATTPDLLRTDSGPDLVDRTGTPPPSPSGDPTTSASASPAGTGWQARRDTLIEYSHVLAEHLDPQGGHLEVLTEDNQNEQIGGGEGGIVSLGAKLGWSNDGEDGLGMVQVSVSNGWRNSDWWCDGEGWTCRQLTADGRVRIAEQDGARRVGVEHPDGEVVVITLDPLFGNNSLVPVSGMDISEKQLVRAASDPRLDLPEGLELPGPMDFETFEAVGRELLLEPGESLAKVRTNSVMDSLVQGRWRVDGADQGHLQWLSTGTFVGGRWATCSKDIYTRCERPTYDGKEIFVGYVKPKWGGGWQVAHVGPTYDVSVHFEPVEGGVELPIERAYALVTDERLHP